MPSRLDARLAITANPQVPETVEVDFKGLYDYPNQFSPQSLPNGALTAATNAVLERPGVIDSRRGFGVYGNTTGTPSQGLTFTTYNSGRLIHCDDNRIYVDNNAGQFAALTSTQFNVPGSYAGSRIRFQEQNGNLYFNANAGIFKIQALNSAPILAGGPQALGGSVVSVSTAANNGPLPASSSVGYRALWEYFDQNNNLIRGVPSTPVIANNASATNSAQVTLAFTVPTTVDTTWTFRVYRSNYGQNPAPPDDNCQLVYSVTPNAAQISARTISFTDNVADLQRGETIYTTTQGVSQAEYRPPIAQDLALYKGSMFYGNCKTYQQLLIKLQTDGVLQPNDNLSFWQGASKLFTIIGALSEDAANGKFKIFTGNTSQVNIDGTAQSICNVINYFAANNSVIDAYYESVINVLSTGSMQFQMRAYTDTPFYLTCSNTTNPALFTTPVPSSGNNVNNTSTNDNNQHYVYFSKSLQPESVPLNNFFAVGSRLTPILRLMALRDVLVIIKSDGLYAIVGNGPTTFTVYPMDVQQNIAGVNTPAVLNNVLYLLAQQGLVIVNQDGSHDIISVPIQQTLMQYTTNNYPNFASASWALASQPEHKYILFTVSSAADTTAQQAYVYDYITKAWTGPWTKGFTSGVVDPVLGTIWATNFQLNNAQVYQERKTLTFLDYCDEQYPLTLTGVTSGNVLSVNSIPSLTSVGDSIYQNPFFSVITAIDSVNNKLTVADTFSWNVSSGLANVCVPIPVTVTTTPIFADDPTKQKQFPEFSIIVDGTAEASFNVAFSTDSSVTSNSIQLSVPTTVGTPYGIGAYGTGVYGGGSVTARTSRLRSYVPQSLQKANWITVSLISDTAFDRVAFSGLQLAYRNISVRQR
jgi:hypothetical protein